jgi:hypothetical protein
MPFKDGIAVQEGSKPQTLIPEGKGSMREIVQFLYDERIA